MFVLFVFSDMLDRLRAMFTAENYAYMQCFRRCSRLRRPFGLSLHPIKAFSCVDLVNKLYCYCLLKDYFANCAEKQNFCDRTKIQAAINKFKILQFLVPKAGYTLKKLMQRINVE